MIYLKPVRVDYPGPKNNFYKQNQSRLALIPALFVASVFVASVLAFFWYFQILTFAFGSSRERVQNPNSLPEAQIQKSESRVANLNLETLSETPRVELEKVITPVDTSFYDVTKNSRGSFFLEEGCQDFLNQTCNLWFLENQNSTKTIVFKDLKSFYETNLKSYFSETPVLKFAKTQDAGADILNLIFYTPKSNSVILVRLDYRIQVPVQTLILNRQIDKNSLRNYFR